MRQHAGLRKSAILLLSLPVEQSEAVLAQLGEPAASQVRKEMGSLGRVSQEEQSAVVEEFRRSIVPAGEPLLAEVDPADPLADIDPSDLMERLHDEHPQTIAAILSMFPAQTSGRCLGPLPVQRQIDLFCRINSIRPLNPAVHDELNRWLESLRPRAFCEPPAQATLLAQVLEDALGGDRQHESGSDS